MKKYILNGICIALLIACVIVIILAQFLKPSTETMWPVSTEQANPNIMVLSDGNTTVEFSEVLLSTHEEQRKLIVSKQKGTISTKLTQREIEILDVEALKKHQTISYEGEACFVVDLDKFTKGDILQDEENKIVTIRIDHAYLDGIRIDYDNIMVEDVEKGLLVLSDGLKIGVKDYQEIEKKIISELEAKFDTAENGQEADAIALKMVKETYEPIVKAIDASYNVQVEFK